ncbi:MAG: glutamate racemase [Methylococcaceae bacterium]|jgi:glutamate racemase
MPHTADPLAPIGVFDSGVGGLSVLRALRQKLPGESFIYVADSGHGPYGDRSPDFIEVRANALAGFLVSHRVKALVLACNTASVVAASRLRAQYTLPIVALEPAIKPAVLLTVTKVVLVLATTNTIRSPSVANLCSTYGAEVNIILQPCPGLMEQVERGLFKHSETRRLLEKYIMPGLAAGADTIVLGCTHYAFLAEEIALIAGVSVSLVEPSEAIARQLMRRLATPPAPCHTPTEAAFYTSGSPAALADFLSSVGEPHSQVYALPTAHNS